MPISFCLIFNRKVLKAATCNGKEHCNLLMVIKRVRCIKFFVGLRHPSYMHCFKHTVFYERQETTANQKYLSEIYFFENPTTIIIIVSWKNAHKAFGGRSTSRITYENNPGDRCSLFSCLLWVAAKHNNWPTWMKLPLVFSVLAGKWAHLHGVLRKIGEW